MNKNFVLLTMMFFFWGNITAINSVIIIFFHQYFHISWQQAMLVTVLFYVAPFVSCIPCSLLISRFGYRRPLQGSLLLCAIGCLFLAATIHSGSLVGALVGIFIVAIGVSALQVVANPYLALLSTPQRRVSNLSLASAVNSLGTTLAPVCIALLLKYHPAVPELHQEPMSGLWLILALFSLMLLAGMRLIRLSDVERPVSTSQHAFSLLLRPHIALSMAAIFVYVGIEVTLATSLIKYLTISAHWETETAMSLITLYWGGALVGRLLFGLFARTTHTAMVFNVAAILCALLVALGMAMNNTAGGWLLLLTGLGNSVMYPIIFGNTISLYPRQANLLAGAMIMAGIGGAIIPWIQALLIDALSLRLSFLLPLAMYLLLGLWGRYALRSRTGVPAYS